MAVSRAKVVVDVNASAERVWDEIAPFNNLTATMPDVITESVLDAKGVVRKLKIKGHDGTLYERLRKYDIEARVTSYDIIDDPNDMVPFNDYVATIEVKAVSDDRCTVEWYSRFVPKPGHTEAECVEFAENIYNTCIAGTKRVLGVT